MAYIETIYSGSTLNAAIYGLDASYGVNDRTVSWRANGIEKTTVSLNAGVVNGGSATLSNLYSTSAYEITAVITAPSWSYIVTIYPRWTWNFSNGSCTATQAKAAYTAVMNKGKTSDFSYQVWNDLVNRVKLIRELRGMTAWLTSYASHGNTCMTSSSKTLTATRFNSLVYNLNNLSTSIIPGSGTIGYVSAGNVVYGSSFVTIATRIDQCMLF